MQGQKVGTQSAGSTTFGREDARNGRHTHSLYGNQHEAFQQTSRVQVKTFGLA